MSKFINIYNKLFSNITHWTTIGLILLIILGVVSSITGAEIIHFTLPEGVIIIGFIVIILSAPKKLMHKKK